MKYGTWYRVPLSGILWSKHYANNTQRRLKDEDFKDNQEGSREGHA